MLTKDVLAAFHRKGLIPVACNNYLGILGEWEILNSGRILQVFNRFFFDSVFFSHRIGTFFVCLPYNYDHSSIKICFNL